MYSIGACLDAFTQGEMLEDDNAYMCQQCHCKVRTLKRTVLKTLPRILILNLKRFEFNFDTMQKVGLKQTTTK